MAGLESAKQLPPHFSQHDINQSFQAHFWESFDGFPTGITAPPFRWSNRSAESALSSTMRRTWACARDRYLKSMAEKPPGIFSARLGMWNSYIFWVLAAMSFLGEYNLLWPIPRSNWVALETYSTLPTTSCQHVFPSAAPTGRLTAVIGATWEYSSQLYEYMFFYSP